MSEKLVVFFSRRGENYAVGNVSEGNAELKKIATGANVKSGLAIKGTDARSSDEKIKKWLEL